MIVERFGPYLYFFVILMISIGVPLLIWFPFFAFSSRGPYDLAKRRGIANPKLAYVPIGGKQWILGSLADQYSSLADGEIKRLRLFVKRFSIVIAVMIFVYLIERASLLFIRAPAQLSGEVIMTLTIIDIILYLSIPITSIVYTVFYYIALNRLYKSCDPGIATFFLVLSIVLFPMRPFLVFANRNKDRGLALSGQEQEEEELGELWDDGPRIETEL